MTRVRLLLLLTTCLVVMFLAMSCDNQSNQLTNPDPAAELNKGPGEGVADTEMPTDPGERERGVEPQAAGAATWPTSMSQFKFPFSGVYNNYYAGEIWKITCSYGCGYHTNTWYPSAGHYSIDLERNDGYAAYGSCVLAPARGKVAFAGWMRGYGWCVVMDHDAGHTGKGYRSIVAHLAFDPNRYVRVGDDLLQGTVLGKCGSSGGDWAAHIHFSVWQYNRTVSLNGISGGASIIPYGRYCSGNALVLPPRGW